MRRLIIPIAEDINKFCEEFVSGSVLERFPGLAIEDEGGLGSLKIREHFLTKAFLKVSADTGFKPVR
jgi:hypothetical protein